MSNNVIKLKPPMVFSEADARRVCAELDKVLEKLCEFYARKREAGGDTTPKKQGSAPEASCSPF
jgi:hypothetical protein